MLYRVGICCSRSNGTSPLMVDLVNMWSVVEKTVTIVEPDVMADDTNKHIKKSSWEGRKDTYISIVPGAIQTPAHHCCRNTKYKLVKHNADESEVMIGYLAWLTRTCLTTFISLVSERGAFFSGWILYLQISTLLSIPTQEISYMERNAGLPVRSMKI